MLTESKFKKATERVWRAQRAYKAALIKFVEHPGYKCREERVNKAAERLNKAVLNLTAATLVNFAG